MAGMVVHRNIWTGACSVRPLGQMAALCTSPRSTPGTLLDRQKSMIRGSALALSRLAHTHPVRPCTTKRRMQKTREVADTVAMCSEDSCEIHNRWHTIPNCSGSSVIFYEPSNILNRFDDRELGICCPHKRAGVPRYTHRAMFVLGAYFPSRSSPSRKTISSHCTCLGTVPLLKTPPQPAPQFNLFAPAPQVSARV